MQVTIVIPTYNEAENLPKLVSAIFELPIADCKILVVDDNSPDGTGDIAEQLGITHPGRVAILHRREKLGLGSAYISGFKHAISDGVDAVCQMDADFSHPVDKIPELLKSLETCDVALGSRYVAGGSVDERWPLWRKALSSFGNFYSRTILGTPIRDMTGGFRMWRRETLLNIPLHRINSNGYAFQVEMAYIAYKLGFKFKEIPIYFADRRWGISKMSFKIQREAATRVWSFLWLYRDLKPIKTQSDYRI